MDCIAFIPRLLTFSPFPGPGLPLVSLAPEGLLTDLPLAAPFSCFLRFPIFKNRLSPSRLLVDGLVVLFLTVLMIGTLLTGLMLLFPPLLLTFSPFPGNFFSLSTLPIELLTGLLLDTRDTFDFFAMLPGTLLTLPMFPDGLLLRFPFTSELFLGAMGFHWLLSGLLLGDPALWTFPGEFDGFWLLPEELLMALLLTDPFTCLTLFMEVTGATFPSFIDLRSPLAGFPVLGVPLPFLPILL